MAWHVELKGDPADLSMLAQSMGRGEPSISQQDGKFILHSASFADLPDARAVSGKAKEILAAVAGLTRLFLGGTSSIEVGGVYRDREGGSRDYTLVAKPASLQLRGMPVTLTVTRADGSKETRRPADCVVRYLGKALQRPMLEKALRLRDQADLGWVELYRIFEVIESEVPIDTMVEKGWASRTQIGLFKHTANSVGAVGDEARHGKESTLPPPVPMEIGVARALIDGVLKAWMDS